MKKLTEAELRKLIAGGQITTLELNFNLPKPDELAQSLCGLANGQGGYIVIGAESENLNLIGIKNVSEAVAGLLQAARLVEPSIEFWPPEPEVYVLDEREILIACVPPNSGVVYQVGGVCWLREGLNIFPMSVQQIVRADISQLLELQRRENRLTLMPSLDRESRLILALLYIQQNEFITNREYRRLTGAAERMAARDLAMLVKTGTLRATGKTRSRQYWLP
jgi:predicted HTH transcriptional regulator